MSTSVIANADYIASLPKAELHLHIEGSLEPEMMFNLAQRNSIKLPYESIDELKAAYDFTDLQSFLDLYYQGMNVLQTEQDFFDLTWAYIEQCKNNNIVHTEIFVDPQGHTERGIPLSVVFKGMLDALKLAKEKYDISSMLIPNFLRHLSEESAIETLQNLKPYLDVIEGIGLDSSEVGHPPIKFKEVFKQARNLGLRVVAHAGEEGPPEYISQAIELLKVERIDHGVRISESEELIKNAALSKIPLTVCPLSNTRLKVYESMKDHVILDLLDKGLLVTVNSDDPAYFGGYINANFQALADDLSMSKEQAKQLAKNSFKASFLDEDKKQYWISQCDI